MEYKVTQIQWTGMNPLRPFVSVSFAFLFPLQEAIGAVWIEMKLILSGL